MCLRFPGLTQSHEALGRLHPRARQFGDAGVSLRVSPSNSCGGRGRPRTTARARQNRYLHANTAERSSRGSEAFVRR